MAFAINMAMVYVAYFICRVEFVLENWSMLGSSLFRNPWTDLLVGSWYFDTSAILYTNALYAILMLFPIHYKETQIWQKVTKWVFFVVNSICIVLNLGDSVYFHYTGRRTTSSVFLEFQNENNIGRVFGAEIISHWYLFVLGAMMIYSIWRFYVSPAVAMPVKDTKSLTKYYALHLMLFLVYIPISVGGMRGGFTTAVRPITISNANQYVSSPAEAAVILNTPFSIFKTIDNTPFVVPDYGAAEMDSDYTAVHEPDSLAGLLRGAPQVLHRKNVVVIIVESFCKQYVEEGYAPFIKSLQQKSLTFDYSFANGRKSIDGMPSVLSSIPMFVEPFFLTSASMNTLSGIAGELDKVGYQTAFFHGAENGSMGFEAFAKATGFRKYYGRTEYDEDSKGSESQVTGKGEFHGDDDFDGTWAIWDEPFLQYYDAKMSEMRQPFMTAIFTASSHHPFVVPEKYQNVYRNDGPNPIHRCIRYTDMALRRFFETASRQPWFKNTIFVITCDHTNGFDQPQYGTDLGVYAATLLFYDPTGQLIKPERRHCIAQQIDIMPTLLGYLGYNKPYIAFGQDLTQTKEEDTWAVNYNNGIYQFIMGDEFYQYDEGSRKLVGEYRFKEDPLLKDNLMTHIGAFGKWQSREMKLLKAITKEYITRMNDNQLTIRRQ